MSGQTNVRYLLPPCLALVTLLSLQPLTLAVLRKKGTTADRGGRAVSIQALCRCRSYIAATLEMQGNECFLRRSDVQLSAKRSTLQGKLEQRQEARDLCTGMCRSRRSCGGGLNAVQPLHNEGSTDAEQARQGLGGRGKLAGCAARCRDVCKLHASLVEAPWHMLRPGDELGAEPAHRRGEITAGQMSGSLTRTRRNSCRAKPRRCYASSQHWTEQSEIQESESAERQYLKYLSACSDIRAAEKRKKATLTLPLLSRPLY